MVYEAKTAKDYWDTLSKMFNARYPDVSFIGRRTKSYSRNNNASDEINAMLNYGYSILESQIRRTINTIGLDPAIGYLHEMKSAGTNTPLVFDLQELYRWIIDLSVIQVLEEQKLGKKDFIVTEDYHIRLEESLARRLINRVKLNFNAKAKYKKQNYTYQNILYDQAQILANYVQDKQNQLQFCTPPIKIRRDDDLEMREAILQMTPDERKELGISKTTLWYMQKNLREGKQIKIYEKTRGKLGVSD